ncbi:hypothetical protein BLNAU_20978 [Blattamonas nauphoetae]|uniref:Uncharacterized protein n=1 Tax=Blattamonas nauphoetae TaxID=2049346 RepID=A0ABQ9WY81_9EUKA|nr:hypothetical protein BLNAU_20978 [Blattamonas nauphoetae]
MFGNFDQNTTLFDSTTATKPISIQSVLDELLSSGSNVSMIVNTPNWNAIPLLIRDWDGKDETTICRLLDEISRILTLVSDLDVPVANKRLLHTALTALSRSPALPKKGSLRITHSLATLDSVLDGPFVLVETAEFQTMAQSFSDFEQRSSELMKHNKVLTDRVAQAEEEKRSAEEKMRSAEEGKRMAEERQRRVEEQKGQALRDKEKLKHEVTRTREDLRKARDEKETSEREKREMAAEKDNLTTEVILMKQECEEARKEKVKSEKEIQRLMRIVEEQKLQLADVPIWVGTESLQTLDRTAHRLTQATLTQIVKLELGANWRTAFTHPIDEGEWELKIRASGNTFMNVRPGFLRHPLPADATQKHCGNHVGGIGGDFNLWSGGMWKDGEFKPKGTNKKCDGVGQTAAIRVNMWTREARLFVDEEEQPGIFTDIPSPLCLGITTGFTIENHSVEVLWLKRLRS